MGSVEVPPTVPVLPAATQARKGGSHRTKRDVQPSIAAPSTPVRDRSPRENPTLSEEGSSNSSGPEEQPGAMNQVPDGSVPPSCGSPSQVSCASDPSSILKPAAVPVHLVAVSVINDDVIWAGGSEGAEFGRCPYRAGLPVDYLALLRQGFHGADPPPHIPGDLIPIMFTVDGKGDAVYKCNLASVPSPIPPSSPDRPPVVIPTAL